MCSIGSAHNTRVTEKLMTEVLARCDANVDKTTVKGEIVHNYCVNVVIISTYSCCKKML